MKKPARYAFYSFTSLVLLVLVLLFFFFKALDNTRYTQTDFYKQELREIEAAVSPSNNQPTTGNLECGWSKVNLLPSFTTPIAIDANRGGKHFSGVHDSIYVRAFVFRQGKNKVAYISADLLIIPPTVTKILDTILQAKGFDTKNIFFTATHTHTSIGGWYNSPVGKIFAGKYDERVPAHIASCITRAILQAEKNCLRSTIGLAEIPARHLVYNRLVTDMAHVPEKLGEVDSMLRIVKIENNQGQKASIVTFAAHCTVFHESMMSISADWAGLMMSEVERSGKIDFCSFSAGAVGSHGPVKHSENQEEEAAYMAGSVSKLVTDVFDSIPLDTIKTLRIIHLPLHLREPNLRVADNFVMRPWLFKKLFGDEKVYINTFQIGHMFFAGMPCDFSGELVNEIDSVADRKNLNLIVTSFNGGYMGYVTDSKWYEFNTYETRTMGWFGNNNGEYLSEVIMRLLEK